MNGEDLEVEVALDNGDTGSETTLKDKQSASSEEGSPAHTRKKYVLAIRASLQCVTV